MHQAFDALFDLDEATIVGDVRDLAEQARVRRIAPCDVLPRIGAQLFQAERNALTLAVELENAYIDLLADLDDFRGMLDALPRHVRDVEQAVDAAQVDECAVVGEVLDDALDGGSFLQVVEQRGALGAVFLFDDRAARNDDVVALLVELDDFEFQRFVFEIRRIAYGAHVHQRARQERAYIVEFHREPALYAAGDHTDDDFLFFERLFKARPGTSTLGLLPRQARLAGAVFDRIQRHFDRFADGYFDFALLVLELVGRNDGLGFQSDVDDHEVLADFDDQTVEDGAGTNALAGDALFKQFRKTFSHLISSVSPDGLDVSLAPNPVRRRGCMKIRHSIP